MEKLLLFRNKSTGVSKYKLTRGAGEEKLPQ